MWLQLTRLEYYAAINHEHDSLARVIGAVVQHLSSCVDRIPGQPANGDLIRNDVTNYSAAVLHFSSTLDCFVELV